MSRRTGTLVNEGYPSYSIIRAGSVATSIPIDATLIHVQPGLSFFVRVHAMPYFWVASGNRFHDDVRLPGDMMASVQVTRYICFVKHVTALYHMFVKKPSAIFSLGRRF